MPVIKKEQIRQDDVLIIRSSNGDKVVEPMKFGTMTLMFVNGRVTYIDRTEREKVE